MREEQRYSGALEEYEEDFQKWQEDFDRLMIRLGNAAAMAREAARKRLLGTVEMEAEKIGAICDQMDLLVEEVPRWDS